MLRLDVTLRAQPLPAADDPIWRLGYDVVRACYELLVCRDRRGEVWG